jgi:hypothetical protein
MAGVVDQALIPALCDHRPPQRLPGATVRSPSSVGPRTIGTESVAVGDGDDDLVAGTCGCGSECFRRLAEGVARGDQRVEVDP